MRIMSEEHIKKVIFLQLLAGMCILCFISVFYSFTLINSHSDSANTPKAQPAVAELMDSIEETKNESATIISEIYHPAHYAMSVSVSQQAESISAKVDEMMAQKKTVKDEGLAYYRDICTRTAVVQFYTQLTGNATVTDAILTYAAKNDISLSLAFALAWGESRYRTNAVNRNTNSSIDRGLFQLNNKSFPKIADKDFFDPYVSARYGLAHLSFCIQTAGNEVAGLAMYNAGTGKVKKDGTPKQTLNYISGILNYKAALDELFTTEVINETKPTVFLAKAE